MPIEKKLTLLRHDIRRQRPACSLIVYCYLTKLRECDDDQRSDVKGVSACGQQSS